MNLRLLLTLIVLLFSQIILSQNVELDKRGGFKSIKLGDSLENFNGFIIKSTDNGLINGVWFPMNGELQYLFDLEIDFFELEFDNKSKKLIKIIVPIVEVEKIENEKYNYLKMFGSNFGKFVAVLGKADECNSEKKSCWWFGNKTAMNWNYEVKPNLLENGQMYMIETLRLTYMDMPYFENKVNKGF